MIEAVNRSELIPFDLKKPYLTGKGIVDIATSIDCGDFTLMLLSNLHTHRRSFYDLAVYNKGHIRLLSRIQRSVLMGFKVRTDQLRMLLLLDLVSVRNSQKLSRYLAGEPLSLIDEERIFRKIKLIFTADYICDPTDSDQRW